MTLSNRSIGCAPEIAVGAVVRGQRDRPCSSAVRAGFPRWGGYAALLATLLAGSGCSSDGDEFFDADPRVDTPPGVVVEEAQPGDGADDAPPAMPEPVDDPPAVVPAQGGSGAGGDDAPPEGDAPPEEPVAEEPSPGASPVRCPAGFGAFEVPELVTGLGIEGNVFGPVLSADGTTLIFSSIPSDGQDEDIFSATRSERGAAFSAAVPIEGLDAGGSTEGTPFLSADGLSLYFFSTRGGPGAPGDRDIWVAERTAPDAPFGEPAVVAGVNAAELDHLPWVSQDHLTLMLVSTRPSPNDASNIWVAERASTADAFGTPVEVEGINTPDREEGFSLSGDGLTIFFGSNRVGAQGMDLWVASRGSIGSAFEAPVNLAVLNSPAADIDASLSADESELFFASDRNGSVQIFRSVRECLPD
jgi:hypothetical protein